MTQDPKAADDIFELVEKFLLQYEATAAALPAADRRAAGRGRDEMLRSISVDIAKQARLRSMSMDEAQRQQARTAEIEMELAKSQVQIAQLMSKAPRPIGVAGDAG